MDFRSIDSSRGHSDVFVLHIHGPLLDWAFLGIKIITRDLNNFVISIKIECERFWIFNISTPDLIALIGEGMKGTPGIAARVFGALAREKVSVIAIAQGSSESNISLVVSQEGCSAAVRAIHQEFLVPAAAQSV